MKNLIFITFVFIGLEVLAAGGPSGGLTESTKKTIMLQALNVAGVLIFFYFLLRKKIPVMFEEKYAQYQSKVAESTKLKKSAEDKLNSIKQEINQYETTFSDKIKKAKANAENDIATAISSAKEQADNMIQGAELQKSFIEKKAQAEFASTIINESIKLSKEEIKEKNGEVNLGNLKDDLFEKFGAELR